MKTHQYIVNKWLIDLSCGFITHQNSGEKKRLGEYQLKLLNVLLQHVGKILSRDELTNLVWKRRVIGNNSLPNAIHTLRVALGDDKKQQRIIQTIPKIGYLLDPAYCEIIEQDEVIPADEEHVRLPEPPFPFSNETEQSHEAEKGDAVLFHPANSNNEPPQATDDESSEGMSLPEHLPANSISTDNNGNLVAELPTDAATQTLILPANRPPPRAGARKIQYLFALLAITALSGAIALFLISPTPANVSYNAAEQEKGAYSNIRMFQITDARFDSQEGDNLYARLKDSLYRLDKDLKTKEAHMNIYYHISLRRLDYTISVETRCNKQQLSMTIYHWRQDNNLLNSVIYHETERKINEIPAC